eukprot:6193919-Pleurochrysis_carterae.AAC.5
MSPIRAQRLGRPLMPDMESEHRREIMKCAACRCACQDKPLTTEIDNVDPQAAVGRTLGRDE